MLVTLLQPVQLVPSVGTQCEVERENGLCPAGRSDVDGTCVSDTGPACTTGTLVGTQCEVERENGLCPAGCSDVDGTVLVILVQPVQPVP